jgi:hypothetical protein
MNFQSPNFPCDENGFPIDEIGGDDALQRWEGGRRSTSAIRVERHRTPDIHPPFYRIGKRVVYSRRLYQLWLNAHLVVGGQPVKAFDIGSLDLTADQKQALAEYLRKVAESKDRKAKQPREGVGDACPA